MNESLTSLVNMYQACIPHVKPGSAIVTSASQAAREGPIPYARSKGAEMTLTRGLAKGLGPDIQHGLPWYDEYRFPRYFYSRYAT